MEHRVVTTTCNFEMLLQADDGQTANILHLVRKADAQKWRADLPGGQRAWLDAHGLKPKSGAFLMLPTDGNGVDAVLMIADTPRLATWDLAVAASSLPGGLYRLQAASGALPDVSNALIGWLLSHYEFARYKKPKDKAPRRLIAPGDLAAAVALAQASALVRDLVNTPTNDMGRWQALCSVLLIAIMHLWLSLLATICSLPIIPLSTWWAAPQRMHRD
jgi:leucyl aminopeptidase